MLNRDGLATLEAVLDAGTFDAAARVLAVTPSAVSQRIRALETRAGKVLVTRTVPVRPTPAGQVLLRAARLHRLVDAEALADLGLPAGRVHARVAVNADSLATWFTAVVARCAGWDDVVLQVHVADQDRTGDLLRAGEVAAAVTADGIPVHGCSVQPLGVMRYLPVAARSLVDRYRGAGLADTLAALPVVRFDEADTIQLRLLAALSSPDAPAPNPPEHRIPSSDAFAAAVRLGLGWGALPREQIGDDLTTGALVVLAPDVHLDVPLYWQRWKIHSPVLDRLTAAVTRAAPGRDRHPR